MYPYVGYMCCFSTDLVGGELLAIWQPTATEPEIPITILPSQSGYIFCAGMLSCPVSVPWLSAAMRIESPARNPTMRVTNRETVTESRTPGSPCTTI